MHFLFSFKASLFVVYYIFLSTSPKFGFLSRFQIHSSRSSASQVWSQNKNTFDIQNENLQTFKKILLKRHLQGLGILWSDWNFEYEMHFWNGTGEGNYKSCEILKPTNGSFIAVIWKIQSIKVSNYYEKVRISHYLAKKLTTREGNGQIRKWAFYCDYLMNLKYSIKIIMTKLTMKEGNYKSCENPTNPQMGLLLRSAEAKMRGWDEGERTNHKSLGCISKKSTNVFPQISKYISNNCKVSL